MCIQIRLQECWWIRCRNNRYIFQSILAIRISTEYTVGHGRKVILYFYQTRQKNERFYIIFCIYRVDEIDNIIVNHK